MKRLSKIALIIAMITTVMLGMNIVQAADTNAIDVKINKTIVTSGGEFEVIVSGQEGVTDYEITFTCDQISGKPEVVYKIENSGEATGSTNLQIYHTQMSTQSTKIVYKDGKELIRVKYKVPSSLENGTNIAVKLDIQGIDKDGGEFTATKTATLEVGEEPLVMLSKIEITKAPEKTTYNVGQLFDKTGMEVTATHTDGTTKKITTYTISPSTALTINDKKVIITYEENGITKTTEQLINVTTATDPGKDTPDKEYEDAGLEDYIMPLIILTSIFGIFSYIKYRKNSY